VKSLGDRSRKPLIWRLPMQLVLASES
jgi:hypothetical protein